MEEIPYDAGNKTHVKREKKLAKFERMLYEDEMNYILESPKGRAIIWRILEECGIYQDIPSHPQETFRLLGRRSVGLWLLAEVMAINEKSYPQMRIEAMGREKEIRNRALAAKKEEEENSENND